MDSNFRVIEGTEKTIACDALAVGLGFYRRSIDCRKFRAEAERRHRWRVICRSNERQETSVKVSFAAGEVTGIGGSDVAIIEGHIAGESASGVESSSKKLLQQRRGRENLAETCCASIPLGSSGMSD
ncbi:MAG: hypothetical protein WDO06_00895 [Actinomycetota bacterium]